MQQSDKSLPNWLVISIFTVWISATLIGLWWFQQSKLRAFIEPTDNPAFFQASHIDQLVQPYLELLPAARAGQQTLVHFWKPDCLCNRVSQRHFSGLLQQYPGDELRVLVIAHPDTSEKQRNELAELNGERFLVVAGGDELTQLPASPALALYSEDKQLGYFGPYGFGAFCTVREDGFLSGIIEQMRDKQTPSFVNVVGDGCFCSWAEVKNP